MFHTLALTLAIAQPQSRDPGELAEQIAPLVNGDTLLVGHTDLRRFDPSRLWAITEALQPKFPPDDARAVVEGVNAQLRRAGVRDVFVVYSLFDLADPPCLRYFLRVLIRCAARVKT